MTVYSRLASALNWSWLQPISRRVVRLLIKVLRQGPVPAHIAFIMDGNRRYAKEKNFQVTTGHEKGFLALKALLESCLQLGVSCVTVYAFSIENFNRNEEEVQALMDMAKCRLEELSLEGELLERWKVRVKILGRKELLSKEVRRVVDRVEEMTCRHTGGTLNIAFPYTSQDEITTAVNDLLQKRALSRRENGTISNGTVPHYLREITSKDINDALSTGLDPPLDLLIRTSGVRRLSDFMLWQATYDDAQIRFVDTLWPDFSIWHMLPILLEYQTSKIGLTA